MNYAVVLLMILFAGPWSSAAQPITYLKPVQLCRLESKKVRESSGVAVSRRDPDRFWTHNDSGDRPRLYCFDREGKDLGTCELRGIQAVDWEDMCSYEQNGIPKLLVADTGDNLSRRKTCQLYIIDEPKNPKKDIKQVRVVQLRYATGAMDCEAVAVDPTSGKIILVEKRFGIRCRVFEADLPPEGKRDTVARPIAIIGLPLVTALDVSPDGRRAIVLTLGQAFEFVRNEGEKWSDAFSRKPRTINMPPRKQGEAVCYGAHGRDLYLTSEFAPAPFFLVRAAKKR